MSKHSFLQNNRNLLDDSCLSKIPASVILEQDLNNPPKLIAMEFCVGWLAEYWSSGRWTCQTCFYGPALHIYIATGGTVVLHGMIL